MRIRQLLGMFLIFATCCYAQTRDSLRAKYGTPTSDTYDSGRGVMLTVTFDSKGNSCSVLIDRRGKNGNTPSSQETLSDADVDPILNDLAPPHSRGRDNMGTFLDVICPPDNCSGSSQDYENVTITWIGNKDHYRYVYVQYKRKTCL